MIIGLASDLHFKLYRNSNNFVPFVEKALSNFYDLCEERKVDRVVLGGDIFNYKSYVQTFALDKAIDSIRPITQRWKTSMVVGNHDMYVNTENEKINLLKVFDTDCNVISDYSFEDIAGARLHYLPYNNDDVTKEKLKSIEFKPMVKNILFTHLAIRGFNLTENHEDIYSDLTASDLDIGFDLVVSGHYHHFQQRGKIVYISSPLESHFGDEGDHGYVFLNTDTLEIEFVPNEYSPKFRTFELTKESLAKIIATKDCFLRVRINKQIDYNILTKLKKKLDSQNYFVTFDYNITGAIQKIGVVDGWDSYIYEDTDKIIKNYVDALETSFNKDKLREYIFS